MSLEKSAIWAVDLDHALLDTDRIFDEIASICETEKVVAAAALHEARSLVESSGGSFDVMGYLASRGVDQEELREITETLANNEAGNEYLYADSREFLNELDERGDPSLILTWGSIMTQLPKLRATGLNRRPYLITDRKRKGEILGTWRNTEGVYQVMTATGRLLAARTACLVDDKAKSFKGLPEDCTGFLVQRKSPKPSQMGSLPERVVIVPDLVSVTAILRQSAKD